MNNKKDLILSIANEILLSTDFTLNIKHLDITASKVSNIPERIFMYKIKYIITGNEFLLPDEIAQELKDKFPNEYKILEKNGKKFKDTKKIKKSEDGSIRDMVVEEG